MKNHQYNPWVTEGEGGKEEGGGKPVETHVYVNLRFNNEGIEKCYRIN